MSSKTEHIFLETKLESWKDIFSLNQRFLTKFIYRGQVDEKWELSTSLERQINKLFPNLFDKAVYRLHEKEMIDEFQWKYPLYSSNGPDKTNLVEWLTIMQHYGTTTRLLDFSHSMFVAIHMAVADSGGDSALWALNKVPLDFNVFNKYREKHNVNTVGHKDLNKYAIELANDILLNQRIDSKIEKQLFVIEPQLCNERLSKQQGLFVMPSEIQCPFSDCLRPYLHSFDPLKINFNELIDYSHGAKYKQEDISLIKIIIPKRLNFQIMKHLRAMNLTTEILFPGLDGLAKSVNYARFSFDNED
uniref:FRG domain-containing protein n=1 Tax=uncultured Draconibacterium sp. TaxID=1573823 RepID=UPI0032177759